MFALRRAVMLGERVLASFASFVSSHSLRVPTACGRELGEKITRAAQIAVGLHALTCCFGDEPIGNGFELLNAEGLLDSSVAGIDDPRDDAGALKGLDAAIDAGVVQLANGLNDRVEHGPIMRLQRAGC